MKHTVVIALLLLAACSDPADKAAKARIFSAEDPPQAVAAAAQRLPPQDAADHPRIARRILQMGAAEVTERLGSHRYTATVEWEWSQVGKKNVRLKETRELIAGPGGVLGDFLAKMYNTDNAGLEVLRVAGEVYARSTWGREGEGRFRRRARDRGMAERIREETGGALRDVDELFFGRLKLTQQSTADSTATFAGRTAWRYAVSLGEADPDSGGRLPPVVTSKAGPDETTRRRLHFYEGRSPAALQGDVMVDAQTSVVLKAHLLGRIQVKGDADAGTSDAELRITLDSALSDIGKPVSLGPPKDFLPDEDKPNGVAAALARVGLDRKSDGGIAGPVELPDDLEEDPSAPPGTPTPAVAPHDAPPKPATPAKPPKPAKSTPRGKG